MSNLPAIPSAQEFQTMKELGQMAISSGFLPQSIKTPEQAVVIMLKGRELGIPPMQAFSGINVIQGKPAVSPELMTALIYKNAPGAVINFIKTDNSECVIEAKRPGGVFNKFSFTMEDAKRANLLDKGNWRTFPAAMLRARCLSAMARALFPDAIAGCSYTPEELGAEVDDEGNILKDAPEQAPATPPPAPAAELLPPEPEDDLANTVITIGKKFKDVKFCELGVDGEKEFADYLDWYKADVQKGDPKRNRSPRGLSANESELIVKFGRFRNRARERFESPPQDWQNEEIPW